MIAQKRAVYVYKDEKYKPIMVYFDRPYPGGIYIGHFNTMQEAEKEIHAWKDKAKVGIPLCGALIDFQKDHGYFDMEGLELLNEYEVV